jgi:hypothetical protein
MIQVATVDCYNESEELTGWFTAIHDNLAVPFQTSVLGVDVIVQRVALSDDDQIIAVCTRGRDRQMLPTLDLLRHLSECTRPSGPVCHVSASTTGRGEVIPRARRRTQSSDLASVCR